MALTRRIDAEGDRSNAVLVAGGLSGLGADAVRLGQRRLATAARRPSSAHLCGCLAAPRIERYAVSNDASGAHLDGRRNSVRGRDRVATRADAAVSAARSLSPIGGDLVSGRPAGDACGCGLAAALSDHARSSSDV